MRNGHLQAARCPWWDGGTAAVERTGAAESVIGVGVSAYAILNAALSTSVTGAIRSAHDHQNHQAPSGAGAA